ncbi:MAG TPA: SpoIIE family protein phosphatase [Tenuifilaceae bacterium]|nr:SpoIIE family protein phosphatase [Tenuifilaceae bacterium]HPE17810.1 SpoIIE family protein phosphatase [Tenuifilaceae bacterium]HPJ45293.1 SpoIIE family protein phosphatase [Tenuifilaceae bacterium]HPQ33640.1 SpoIIE family protein phosphatase [Tenuifilaceae bacterium]HRX67294.1 SpoIIE family protein phosphatase [Tenuifilaceae bacterium]
MQRFFFIIQIIVTLLSVSIKISAQEIGQLSLKNFTHREYLGHSQNWAVVQDYRGLIYVANNTGVLEYDGHTWRTIPINGALARCLDTDNNGRVWVGGQDELGYIAADSSNTMRYFSLNHLIDDACKPLGLVRQVYVTPMGIFFSTNNCIIRITEGTSVSWFPKTIFHRTYFVSNNIYTIQPNVGLTILEEDSLRLVPKGDMFDKIRIYCMVPFDRNHILLGTQNSGFFLYNTSALTDNTIPPDSIIKPFNTSNNQFFKDNWVYNGIRLPNGDFAIGTYRGGVAVFNSAGQINHFIGKEQGLQDESIWYINHDSQENIWLALNNGISYASINSQITYFNESMGYQGVLQSVVRHNGKILVSSNAGVFALEGKRFKRVDGILNLSWEMKNVTSSNGKIATLAATGDGIYEIIGGKAELIQNGASPAFSILQSKFHKNIVYVGLYDGLGILTYKNGQWEFVGKLNNISGRIYSVDEDNEGNIWFIVRYNGVYKIKISNPLSLQVEETDVFVKLPHSPKFDEDARVNYIYGSIKVSTEKGLSQFQPLSQSFVADSSLGTEFTDGNTGIRIYTSDAKGNLWFEAFRESHTRWIERAVMNSEGTFLRIPGELNAIPKMIFYGVYNESNGVTWIAGSDALFRFDPEVNKGGRKIPRVLIRKVNISNNGTLFGGAFFQPCSDGYTNCTGTLQPSNEFPILSYANNSISFDFSSPYFDNENRTLFSFMLKGFDETWSEWIPMKHKEYTNLTYGTYQFMVKALSIYDIESPVATYSFTILRPWYHHPAAYFFYIVLLILIISISVGIKTKMLKTSNLRLQKLVAQRTKEISEQQTDILEKNEELTQQKEELQSQRDELQEQNKQIRASLQYALTIQQAILPEKQTLNKYFENFVVFKPKDVVSGDFFWFSHLKNQVNNVEKLFVAVVDCTGHGVPGAFMSLIGNRMLSEIINERKIFNPATILRELNNQLNIVLHQDSSENFDGMDVCLCSIEKANAEQFYVTFAGANRPLFYYTQGSDKINVVKGNRKSIGGLMPDIDNEFENKQIILSPNDMLFLCTDGLQDQNNDASKKFTSYRFHNLLLSNIDKPMEEIGSTIIETYENFKGHAYQRDDITILGIKLPQKNSFEE